VVRVTDSPLPGSWPVTTSLVARLTSPVKSGTDMQPSLAFSLREACTICGFTMTNRPWHVLVFGCALTSRQKTRHGTPT
jgi:hypothetical protein